MERSGQRLWWILLLVAVFFLGGAVLRFFDPAQATQNPYSDLELYAGTPIPATLRALLGILSGVLGLLSVAAVEFGLSSDGRFRPLTGAVRFFAMFAASAGFLLLTIHSFRALELIPDLAHYYYSLDDPAHHAPALMTMFIPVDPNQFFFAFGGAVWALTVSIDLIKDNPRRWVTAIIGLVYAGAFFAMVLFVAIDRGFASLILTIFGFGAVAPAWFIALAFHLRRLRSDAIRHS